MKFDKSLLKITPASYKEAKQLERNMLIALRDSPMKIGLDNIDKKNPLKSDLSDGTMGELIKSVLYLASSNEVEESLFTCGKRAVYGNEKNIAKITEEFFEPLEHRELYYPIMFELIKVNVLPFIKGLFSQFGGSVEKIKSFLK